MMKCNHACIAVHADLWRDIMTQGNVALFKVAKGLPKDAQYVRTWYDDKKGIVYFVFAHPTFPEIEHNEVPIELGFELEDLSGKSLLELITDG